MPPFRRDDLEGARCVHGEARERRRPGTIRETLGVRYCVKPLFTLGQVVATPGPLAAIEKAGQQPGDFLARHARGDWGQVPPGRHQRKRVFTPARLPAPERLPHQHGGKGLGDYRS